MGWINAQKSNHRIRIVLLKILAATVAMGLLWPLGHRAIETARSLVNRTPSLNYTVTVLRPPDGLSSSYSSGINNNGDVLITASSTRPNSRLQSYVWQHGVFTLINSPGVKYMQATGLNDNGQVVGKATLPTREQRPFLWRDGKTIFLPTLGVERRGTFYLNEARSINNDGQVVGSVFAGDHIHFAGWDKSGKLTDGGASIKPGHSMAMGTNSKGQIVGYLMPDSGPQPFFLSSGGKCVLINPLGHDNCDAFGINDKSEVVGSFQDTNLNTIAFIYHNGETTCLDSPNGTQASALAINNSSQVVGYLLTQGKYTAVLWINGKMLDLNSLIPPGSGWKLREASAINDHGQIVGDGDLFGKPCAFLLTPTTPNRR